MGSLFPIRQGPEESEASLESLTLGILNLFLSEGSLSSPMDILLRSGEHIVDMPDRSKVWAPSFLVEVLERLEWEFLLPGRASGNVVS